MPCNDVEARCFGSAATHPAILTQCLWYSVKPGPNIISRVLTSFSFLASSLAFPVLTWRMVLLGAPVYITAMGVRTLSYPYRTARYPVLRPRSRPRYRTDLGHAYGHGLGANQNAKTHDMVGASANYYSIG
eukprot:3146685-Rhodomonas_salina.5